MKPRLKMADVPVGSRLIDNPVSSAPGFQIENVYVLPWGSLNHAGHVRWYDR